MFDVGFTEVFLLALIGLLVLGPERLPGVARTLGGFVRKARMSWISLRNTIESELEEADLSKPIKKTSEELKKIGKELTETPVLKSGKHKSDTAGPGSISAETSKPDPRQESDSGKSENV
jgi:sec-independent protein translocase protein TatB